MAAVDKLLIYLRDQGASDLHLVADMPPRVRVRGGLVPISGMPPLSNKQVRGLMREIVDDEQWQTYEHTFELDFAYSIAGVARFRGNVFHQTTGAAAVFRMIPDKIMSIEQLKMPPAVEQFAHIPSGLVLVTGPTGSGKSTTLAAIINTINNTYERHILTIEDPIEFVHTPKRSMISHREVGEHTESFASALRSAMRQNPDVILVGELRGPEIELAIAAAEMGMLVFGTLHTNSASKAIDRLIDAVEPDAQEQIRIALSEALAGVVAQLLLKTADGTGRVAAVEVLVKTSGLPNIIREANTPQIVSTIQAGRAQGMQLMDDHLMELRKEGIITAHDAYMAAVDKMRFEDQPEQTPESDDLGG